LVALGFSLLVPAKQLVGKTGFLYQSADYYYWTSYLHPCAFITKQNNLVPAKRQWCSLAGKVTVGLSES